MENLRDGCILRFVTQLALGAVISAALCGFSIYHRPDCCIRCEAVSSLSRCWCKGLWPGFQSVAPGEGPLLCVRLLAILTYMGHEQEAYFAGLIDGEGCITIKRTERYTRGRRSPTYVFSLCVEMADPRPIKAMCDFFDLTFNHNTSRHLRNPTMHRYLFVAQCGRQKGIEILLRLLPFLKAKREEAEVAIEFYETCFPDHHAVGRARRRVPEELIQKRHAYYLRLRELKVQRFTEFERVFAVNQKRFNENQL